MANIYGVVALDAAQHKGYSDFVQHTNPLKGGLLQTLITDNLLNSLNSVDSTESVNALIKLDYNESLELANLLILFNYRESRESANSLKMLQAPNSGFARRLGNSLEIQKEKGSVRSTALWDDCFFNHEENHYSTDLDNNADLRHEKNQQVSHPSLRGEPIPTTIGGWDMRLYGTLSPAQTLHTEIIGIQNLQVTKRHPQNNPEIIGAVHSANDISSAQPFGSMPRFRSSSRPSSFNQLPRLTSSFLASFSNCSFRSRGIRIWKVGALPVPFGCLSRLMIVDMYVPIEVMFLLIGTYIITMEPIRTTPYSASTHAGRLTKPLIEVTIMACFKSTQTHPKFQYRFLALNRHDRKAKPCRLSVEATTEHEARRILAPHFILSFAARLPVQEVHHA